MTKTYYTVPNKASNDTFTEQMWDDYIKTNGNNVITPASCEVVRSSQGVASGGTDLCTFTSETWDNDSMWSIGDSSKIYLRTTGVWLVQAFMSLTGGPAYGWLSLNGGSTLALGQGTSYINFSAVFRTTSTSDYINLVLNNYGGGGTATFSGIRVAAIWQGKP